MALGAGWEERGPGAQVRFMQVWWEGRVCSFSPPQSQIEQPSSELLRCRGGEGTGAGLRIAGWGLT